MNNKPKQVEQLSIDSSRYLRENLKNNDQYYNTVQKEIELVQDYLKIVNVMSAIPITLRIICPSEAKKRVIPNMLLQPLVENAIKHGLPPKYHGEFQISIKVQCTDNRHIEIVVEDNGVGFVPEVINEVDMLLKDPDQPTPHIGQGLASIIRRLKLQCKEDFCFRIGSASEIGASIFISLQCRNVSESGTEYEEML